MTKSPSRSTSLGRVLVIDDEPDMVDLLRQILAEALMSFARSMVAMG